MGQSSSQLNANQTSSQMANCFHICNIIPDTPEHHHQMWLPQGEQKDSRHQVNHSSSTKKTVLGDHTYKYHSHSDTDDSHKPVVQDTPPFVDYTTDDESDTYKARVRRVRRVRRHKQQQRRSGRNQPSSQKRTHAVEETPATNNTYSSDVAPNHLDRRYDLDIAPSMINMDLRFNGALMVVSALYNIFLRKFGYQHMLSVQMLYWMAVHKYYQVHNIDCTNNYKLSLCTFLDVIQELSLCSERELSIYTDIVKKGQQQHHQGTDPDHYQSTPTSTFAVSSIASQDVFCKPFYRMQYYYVPKDIPTIKQALLQDHLVLANLTLFSNFLSSRGGVLRFPNSTDQSAGMIVVTIVGYQDDVWIVKFPFGLHWGENGCGYVPFDYFDRYNRDRWIIDVDECGEPPEYIQQRKQDQMNNQNGLIAAHMNDELQHTRNGTTSRQHKLSSNCTDAIKSQKHIQHMRRRAF